MFRVEMLPARQGDALLLEYGDAGSPHRVLFDAGTPGTWATLKKRLARLPADQRGFELLVVSHVDADHIGGSLPLLRDRELGLRFDDVWFNGWRHLPQTVEPMGPIDGEVLSGLVATGPWNAAWDGKAVVVPDGDDPPPARTLPGGLKLTLLSPGEPQLSALRPVWEEVVRAAGLVPGVPPAEPERAEGLEPLGPEIPDVPDLLELPFSEDTAEANGSSIALLAEYECDRVLLAADAFPSVIEAGVARMVVGGGRLDMSAFKLPHHGSKANISPTLLERIATDRFLFSTDGTQTRHPHPEAIARVLHAHPGATLEFNYRTKYTEPWLSSETAARYEYATQAPQLDESGLVVTISD
jgi:hypothetical protein